MKPLITFCFIIIGLQLQAQTYDTSYKPCNKDTTTTFYHTVINHHDSILYNVKKVSVLKRLMLRSARQQATDTLTLYDTTITPYDSTYTCIGCDVCMVIDTIPPLLGIEYGGFFLTPGAANKIAAADQMGEKFTVIRYNTEQNDAGYQTQQFKDAGYKVYMCYNWRAPHDPGGFPVSAADRIACAAGLSSRLAISKPDYLGYQNEPPNQDYYPRTNPNNTPQNYINMLDTLIGIAHTFNVKISDGGLLRNVVYNAIEYYQQLGHLDTANYLLAQIGQVSIKGAYSQDAIAFNKPLLNYFKTSALDYVSWHDYQPKFADSTWPYCDIVKIIIKFLRDYTGKDVIVTEFGTTTSNPAFLTHFLDDMKEMRVPLQIYFMPSGNSGNAPAKDLRAVYKDYLDALLY